MPEKGEYKGHRYYETLVSGKKAMKLWYDNGVEPLCSNGPQGSEGAELIEKLLPLSKELFIDTNEDGYADTIFIEVKEDYYKEFMMIIFECRPNEFDEGDNNVFRIWWD